MIARMSFGTLLLALLLAAFLLTAPTAVAQSSRCEARAKTFDTVPALFDDFAYSSTAVPPEAAARPSVFGENWWRTAPHDSTKARAWYRYNRYDLPMLPADVKNSTLVFRLPKGFSGGGHEPTITSSFLTRNGTYATRVRLDRQAEGDGVIQALWLLDPKRLRFNTPEGERGFRTELDMEYMWEPPRLLVSNKAGKLYSEGGGWEQEMEPLNCAVRSGSGKTTSHEACLTEAGSSLLRDRWGLLVMHVRDDQVDYALFSPRQTRSGERLPALWAGGGPSTGATNWGRPLVLNQEAYLPTAQDLVAKLSLLYYGKKPLSKPYQMNVDWMFYSPCTTLTYNDLQASVATLRGTGAVRINTTERPTSVPEPPKKTPHTAHIAGPDSLAYGETGTWTVQPSLRSTRFIVTYQYQLVRADGSPEAWKNVYAPTFSRRAGKRFSGVNLRATVRDYWFPVAAGSADNHTATAMQHVAFGAR